VRDGLVAGRVQILHDQRPDQPGSADDCELHCMDLSPMTMSDMCLGGANFTQAAWLAQPHGVSPTCLAAHSPSPLERWTRAFSAGEAGGYVLTRSPVSITVLDVVEAVEGLAPWLGRSVGCLATRSPVIPARTITSAVGP
jgi:hypothetical protein